MRALILFAIVALGLAQQPAQPPLGSTGVPFGSRIGNRPYLGQAIRNNGFRPGAIRPLGARPTGARPPITGSRPVISGARPALSALPPDMEAYTACKEAGRTITRGSTTMIDPACMAEMIEQKMEGEYEEGSIPEGYNTPIPPSVLTPDLVLTKTLGALQFQDGYPSKATVEKLYNHLDHIRAVDVFLNMIPMASLEALRLGHEAVGVSKVNEILIFDKLLDSNALFLTGNTDTVYVSHFMDLGRDGPTVVQIPKGAGPSTANDAYFRFVADMGSVGPDAGEGGKYLFLPPDYEGPIKVPRNGQIKKRKVDGEEYWTVQSPSYVTWVMGRGFLVDGKPDYSNKMYRENYKVYPLSEAANPPETTFFSASEQVFNTIHANNYDFYEEIAPVIEREPLDLIDPELRGQLSAIGIQKGKPFEPDERMKEILVEGAKVANGIARALTFVPRDEESYYYPDRKWYSCFVGGSHEWLKDGGEGGRYMDARTIFFYFATVNTPAMVVPMIGKGSQYLSVSMDKDENFLDGSKNYKLVVPPNAPAKDFWSVVVYDPQTRSELQTSQFFPSMNNKKSGFVTNEDGSVDVYFGPTAPEGFEENWLQTVPGKGWFAFFRAYGPLEAYFDKTWVLGDVELIEKEGAAITKPQGHTFNFEGAAVTMPVPLLGGR